MIHIKHKDYDRTKILIEELPKWEAQGWSRMTTEEEKTIPFHAVREPQVNQSTQEEPKRRGRKKTQPIDEDYTS